MKGRSSRLRALLDYTPVSFMIEAHNAISARIVEEAGFPGIWASSFCTSAAMGLRDCNEASTTQILDVVELMVDSTSIPILVDGDTGFGNFNNARLFVRKLCQRGASGICIEDAPFPNRNSLISGGHQLVAIDEFCGKIKACKDSQLDDAFVLIARCEALVAKHNLSEALLRAEAYIEAGADAILIHSNQPTWVEVRDFCLAWANHAPVVIVPTTYQQTSVASYSEAGVSLVIWANHTLRAAVLAMRAVCSILAEGQNPAALTTMLASIEDLFSLTNLNELLRSEEKYTRLAKQNGERKSNLSSGCSSR